MRLWIIAAAALCFTALSAKAEITAEDLVGTSFDCELGSPALDLKCRSTLAEQLNKAGYDAMEGAWAIKISVSPLDDSTAVFITTRSENVHKSRSGREETLWLYLRCMENTTSAYIDFAGEFMASGASDTVPLTYRIDKEEAKTVRLTESNSHESLGWWSGSTAIPFIKDLIGKEQLYVRAMPYNESLVDGTFELDGLEQAIKPLREACHW